MPLKPDFCFHIAFTGKVDRAQHIIRGVSLMTGDLEAEGHALHVDHTTLGQVLEWSKKLKKVTVKCDHKGPDGKTFNTIVGYLTDFRAEGNKVRGDLHLLESEPLTPKIEEMADRMPENFGLSAAFKGKGERGKGATKDKQFARVTKLLSVDLVENPAANPDGLFSAVDTGTGGMPDPIIPANGEPTLKDVLAAITDVSDRLKAVETFQQEVSAHLSEPNLAELARMSDDELIAAGFDPVKVAAAVADAQASGELESGEGQGEGAGASEGAGAGAASGAGAAAAGAVGAALAALQKQVTQLAAQRNNDIRMQEAAEVENAFAVIEEKIAAVQTVNAEQAGKITQLEAENKALKLSARTGVGAGRPAPGIEGTTLFTSDRAKEGTFEKIVSTRREALVKGGMPEVKANAEAVRFAIKTNPDAYAEFRERGGKTMTL